MNQPSAVSRKPRVLILSASSGAGQVRPLDCYTESVPWKFTKLIS
jgi:hypothetical protein